MAHRLVIRDGELRGALSAIRDSCADFELAQDESDTAADASGHKGLANVLRNAASSWSVRRGKLIEALEGLGDHMQQTIDLFDQTDVEMGAMLSSAESDPGVSQSSPESASHASPDSVSQSAPAPVSQSSSASPSFAYDNRGKTGATATSTVHPTADAAESRVDVGPAASSAAGAPSSMGLPADVAAVPATSPTFDAGSSMAGPAISGPTQTTVAEDADPRLSRAHVEQLVTTLVNRWQSLGGAEQAVIGALTAAGLGGAAASFHARASTGVVPSSSYGSGNSGLVQEEASSSSQSSLATPTDPAAVTSDVAALAAESYGPAELRQQPSREPSTSTLNAPELQQSHPEAGEPPELPLVREGGATAQEEAGTPGLSGLAARLSGHVAPPVMDLPPLAPLTHEELVAPSLGTMPSLMTDPMASAAGPGVLPPLAGESAASGESTSVAMLPPLGAAMAMSSRVGEAAAPASGASPLAGTRDAAGDLQTRLSDREEQARRILHGLREHRSGEEDRS